LRLPFAAIAVLICEIRRERKLPMSKIDLRNLPDAVTQPEARPGQPMPGVVGERLSPLASCGQYPNENGQGTYDPRVNHRSLHYLGLHRGQRVIRSQGWPDFFDLDSGAGNFGHSNCVFLREYVECANRPLYGYWPRPSMGMDSLLFF
jgi:hypothetical protein